MKTADELPGFGARSYRLASLPEDYPVNTLLLFRFVWFLSHNSKGKASTAILSMGLRGYWKSLIRKAPVWGRVGHRASIGQDGPCVRKSGKMTV